MDIGDILKSIAPVLATAVAGPLGGAAVEAIGTALGLKNTTVDAIKNVIQSGLTPEQQLALKQADQQFQLQMQQQVDDMITKLEDLAVKDRDSARQRESAVKDNTNKILAYTIVGSFIAMTLSILLGYSKVDSAMTGMLVGYASAKCEQVVAYYFGSSKGSDDKTKWMLKNTNAK